MKDRNRRTRIANNRFPFVRFIRLFTGIEILLVFLYTKYFATFSVYGDRVRVLLIIAAVAASGSLVLSWRLERNWASLIGGTFLPVLLYEAISMRKYFPVIRIMLVAGGSVSVAVGFFYVAKKLGRIKRIRNRRKVFIIKTSHAARSIYCLVLLCACLYGKAMIATHYRISYSEIEYVLSNTYNDITDYDNSLTANIETVAKIDPEGGWGSLSVDEKTEVLKTIIRIECRYLGMYDSAPSLELAYLEEGLLGQYDNESDVITLSYNYVIDSKASGYSVLQVLCHELYHRYQRYQVDLLQAIRNSDDTAKYADLLVLNNAGIYEDELNNYISPDDDTGISYYLYSSQKLERDAEKYGNASAYDYYEQIRAYLEPNE